jgi:GR25 family glycosyltransferase involved in LPS biosynthesis
MNLNEAQILIIGVPERYRGHGLEESVKNLGLSFVNIDGINGSNLAHSVFERETEKHVSNFLIGRELTRGEYCCARAHIQAYTELVESDKNWAIVLEDDAILAIDFIDELKKLTVIDDIPTIIQLYGIETYQYQLRNFPWILSDIEKAKATKEIIRVSRYWPYPERTHGYLINKSAARIAVEKMERSLYVSTADWPFEWRSKISFSVSVFPIIELTSNGSIIDEDRSRILFANRLFRLKGLIWLMKNTFRLNKSKMSVDYINLIVAGICDRLLSTWFRMRKLLSQVRNVGEPKNGEVS